MTGERFSVGVLKTQIREEFGLQDTPDINRQIVDKLNQAQRLVVRRRKSWPFLRTQTSIDVSNKGTFVANVTQGSRDITYTSGTLPAIRDVIVLGDSTAAGLSGHLVTNVAGSVVTLNSQFRTATAVGSTFTTQTGFRELPNDFIQIDGLSKVDGLLGDRVHYLPPAQFDHCVRIQQSIGPFERIYTVKPDPLNSSIYNNFFLAFYPYVNELTTFACDYFRDPPRLNTDSDIPLIDLSHREVIYQFASYYMAVSLGRDTASIYKNQADESLEYMTKDLDQSYDTDTYERRSYGVPKWITPPSGYPWWE